MILNECSFVVANHSLEGFEVALGPTGKGRYAYLPFGGETGLQPLFEDHTLLYGIYCIQEPHIQDDGLFKGDPKMPSLRAG